jgi:hypothetical protein
MITERFLVFGIVSAAPAGCVLILINEQTVTKAVKAINRPIKMFEWKVIILESKQLV